MKTKQFLLLCILLPIRLFAAPDGRDPGNEPASFPETDLLDAAPRAVFVATMGNFKTPEGSGRWGSWNHPGKDNQKHDPDSMDATGRRDISSCYYPAIGPYDMSDPSVAEYHCQLMKMAGIDGISFNISYFQKDPWRRKSMRNYVDAMLRYGLKGMIRYENKTYEKDYPDPKERLEAAYADMDAWLKVLEPVQFRIAGRPVFTLFSFHFTPGELEAWKEKYPKENRPIIVTVSARPAYTGVVEGQFGWTGDSPNFLKDHPPCRSYVPAAMAIGNSRENLAKAADKIRKRELSFYMAGVSPGFDDIGCWGWGSGPRKVERDDGRVYESRWEMALETGLHTVLIPTWNDWDEGTTIEPAVEYGDRYLAITRTYAARWKGMPVSSGNLLLPVWIYKIRKKMTDGAALRDMETASDFIAQGKFEEAEKIVKPWAEKLGVMEARVWDAASR